jgi:hypothetical protein
MTEPEWVACTDPESMLEFLCGASGRKLRLFACACCRHTAAYADAESRRTAAHGHDPSEVAASQQEAALARRAAEVAERYADGLTVLAELQALFAALDDDELERCYAGEADAARAASGSAYRARWCANYCSPASYPPRAGFRSASAPDHDRERSAQCQLLRDIFSNPFRPAIFFPEWRTDTAVALAGQMYEAREFSAVPILADALQDAGCNNARILDHCRGPGPHVRGCWVVDLVLGKE